MCSDLQEWARLLASVGFPVAAAGYLIVRVDATLGALTKEIMSMNGVLQMLFAQQPQG